MIRRINHTGRRRIGLNKILITVDDRSQPPTFKAQLNFDGQKFNSDAKVIVEAYRGSGGLWLPFDWGRVGALKNPPVAKLEGIDSADGLLFRVRVVATHEPHKILGEADRIPFLLVGEAPSRLESLIKVMPADLGDLIWDVDFDPGQPQLRINRSLGNWAAVARDPAFRALVYPTLLREILVRIFADGWSSDVDDEDDWRARWIMFSRLLAPNFSDALDDKDEQQEFIDAATSALATRVQAVDEYRKHLAADE